MASTVRNSEAACISATGGAKQGEMWAGLRAAMPDVPHASSVDPATFLTLSIFAAAV